MSCRAFNPTAKQSGWVEAMIGCGIPEDEIRLLIKNPHTGKPIDLATLRKHFAKEIATGAVNANLRVGNFVLASILGRDGGVQDDQKRVRLAIFFAKTRMGWTAEGRERVVDPIDAGDALQSLNDEIVRLARGLKAGETGGSSVG